MDLLDDVTAVAQPVEQLSGGLVLEQALALPKRHRAQLIRRPRCHRQSVVRSDLRSIVVRRRTRRGSWVGARRTTFSRLAKRTSRTRPARRTWVVRPDPPELRKASRSRSGQF